MTYRIDQIEGIGPSYAAKLQEAGIRNTNRLLKLCCTRKGRRDVAAITGLSEKQLLRWANMADLMRIWGIGAEYAELLEASGVDTIKELGTRKPQSLTMRMEEVNLERKLTRRVPSARVVADWVEAAQQMSPVITH